MRLTISCALLGVALCGCAATGQSALTPAATPTTSQSVAGQRIPAIYDCVIDPGTLTATVMPRRGNTASPQAKSYDLDIATFLTRDAFVLTRITLDSRGDLNVEFVHRHPFPTPDFAAPPTATNRADLGYTGRLLILTDLTTGEVPSHTWFGDTIANTDVIRDADGYCNPGDLLVAGAFTANTFPYVLLADDLKDNRVNDSTGGSGTGSYDPDAGGWQVAPPPKETHWTGYDYVHQGQTVVNRFT
ncbi:MAG: hypothetical protein ABI743_05645, partial [bacterium]